MELCAVCESLSYLTVELPRGVLHFQKSVLQVAKFSAFYFLPFNPFICHVWRKFLFGCGNYIISFLRVHSKTNLYAKFLLRNLRQLLQLAISTECKKWALSHGLSSWHEHAQAKEQLLFKLFLGRTKPIITKGPNKVCLFYSKEYAGSLIRCMIFTILCGILNTSKIMY